MSPTAQRVLVVDDDAQYRQLLMGALAAEGFDCEQAENGAVAARLLATGSYDLLLADLQMPVRNGHALVAELLARKYRPAVVALTGIVEPKLAADLLARGAEDVIFKPVEFRLLAAKLKALLATRRLHRMDSASCSAARAPLISEADLETRLINVSHVLPISDQAFEVARKCADVRCTAKHIAAALAAAPALAVEVLRLANSRFFASPERKTASLEEAAMRIGLRRVGEIALALSALQGVANRKRAWIDLRLLSQQGFAAAIALRLLIERAGLHDDGGLMLSALTQDLGRVVLGELYPEIYERLAQACAETNMSLLQLEDGVFPRRHVHVMAELLTRWGLQPCVCIPLRHTHCTYKELESVREPLRSKAEICKLAGWLGRIAVGRWEDWDVIEPAPGSLLAKLGIRSIDELLNSMRAQIESAETSVATNKDLPLAAGGEPEALRHCSYVNLSSPRGDALPHALASMGIRLQPVKPEHIAVEERIIINCLGVPPKRLEPYFGSGVFADRRCIIADARHFSEFQALARTVSLPGSYAALRAAGLSIFRNDLQDSPHLLSQATLPE